MSLDWYGDVCEFMKKFGQKVKTKPEEMEYSTLRLRASLIEEEFNELMCALGTCNDYMGTETKQNLEGIADGACDLIVVVLGTLAALGIDPKPIWNEIHRTNMAKEGGGKREDGKILKPKGWTGPDIKRILIEQGLEGDGND